MRATNKTYGKELKMNLNEFEQTALDIEEFEKAVINGQITNYRPYVENGTFNENRNRKQICIEHGVAQELYPEWAQSNDPDESDNWIQILLAENGYCLDILSESEDEEVLTAVLSHDLNYALDDILLTDYRHLVYDALMNTINIPLNVLEYYFKTKNDDDDETALELKLKAISHTPTTIEKTMTPAQLYASDNPLWALNFAGYDINKLFKRLENQPKTEEAFNTAVYNIQNPMLVLDEFGNLRLNKHVNRIK